MNLLLGVSLFLSAVTVINSEIDEDHFFAGIDEGRRRFGQRKNNTGDDNGGRAKRSTSATDRDTILTTFNEQRSLVGAANMNYLNWNYHLENDANNWTSYCDADRKLYPPNSTILYFHSETANNHVYSIKWFFEQSNYFNWVTSTYLRAIGGGYTFCSTVRANDQNYTNVYLYGYVISYASDFNRTIRQFISGDACTKCDTGVNWCYKNLCRGDCSDSTDGCCPIANNIPTHCVAPNIEVKGSIVLFGIVLALYSYFF